jgi:hypothetical protein
MEATAVQGRQMDEAMRTSLLAWQSVLPDTAVFTHLTDAEARGWWLPPLPAGLPVLAAMPKEQPRPRRRGLVVVRHRDAPRVELTAGVRRTPSAETLLSCARDLSLLDLVVLADCALHRGDVTVEALTAAAEARRRGAPLLRQALSYADGRSESPWETLLRVLHVVCGIDVEPQYELVRDGTLVARGDLRLTGTTTLHEYDGAEHLARPRQRKDLKRTRRLGHADWTRHGYTREDVLHQGIGILRDADQSLGRAHDPGRIRAWNALLRESCFTPAGTARLARRLGVARDDTASEVVTPSRVEPACRGTE